MSSTQAHAEDADDVALADVADGDLSKRCRDFSSSVLEGGGSVGATLRQWHAAAGLSVAPWHDDDEPPLRVGHDRRHALGRHAAVGGVRDARLGGAEALYWDSEDAALPLAAAATPNRPLAALRAALETLRGADAASKFVSDEAIRLSGWGGRALKKKKKGPGLGHARPAKSALKNGAAPADDAPGAPLVAAAKALAAKAEAAAAASAPSADPRRRKAAADPRARRAAVKDEPVVVVKDEPAPAPADEAPNGFSEEQPKKAADPRRAADPRKRRRAG